MTFREFARRYGMLEPDCPGDIIIGEKFLHIYQDDFIAHFVYVYDDLYEVYHDGHRVSSGTMSELCLFVEEKWNWEMMHG